MSVTEPPATPQGRDSHGRFTKGNAGGPGNPHARQVAALRQRLLDKVTAEEMDAILDALLLRAREGDVGAAKLILQYTLGKPLEARDPDRLDADEIDAFYANALSQRTAELVKIQPMELMLPIFRILLDAKSTGTLQQFAQAFAAKNGPDGQGKPPRKTPSEPPAPPASTTEQVALAQPVAPKPAVTKREQTDQRPAAAPKPTTVTKRKQPEPALPDYLLPQMLLTALLATPADLTTPTVGKREPTEVQPPSEPSGEAAVSKRRETEMPPASPLFPALPASPPPPDEQGSRRKTARHGSPGLPLSC